MYNIAIGVSGKIGNYYIKNSKNIKNIYLSRCPNKKKNINYKYEYQKVILEKPNKTNIIVVPQNIYTQWIMSIENFSKKLSYKKLFV